MRTFLVTRRGAARVMRTYPLGKRPAPDALDEIAKWSTAAQAEVTSVREISEDDIRPFERHPGLGIEGYVGLKEAWRDTGSGIEIDMPAARTAQAGHIRAAKTRAAQALLVRHAEGEDIDAERAQLGAIDADALVADASDPAELKERWPAVLEQREASRVNNER